MHECSSKNIVIMFLASLYPRPNIEAVAVMISDVVKGIWTCRKL